MKYPLANVHPEAKIGHNVIIEPFATIKADVVIGDNCWIAPYAIIWEGAHIGKNVKIYSGASVSSTPQDLKYNGEVTKTYIGDNTIVREYVTISRGTADKLKTIIESNCLLMSYVHVAHDCHIGSNCILVNGVQVAGHVKIDDWAIVGGSSAVHQFVHVGAHTMISGGSLIRKDVPPYIKAAREPLTYMGINSIGLRRRGFSLKKISELQEVYRTIFMKGYNKAKALEEIEKHIPTSQERDYIVYFIRNSERGITKGPHRFLNLQK